MVSCSGTTRPHRVRRPQNRLRRRRGVQRRHPPRRKARERVGDNGAEHRDCKHQRRLTHRLQAVDGGLAVAAGLVQLHPEVGRHVRAGRDLVGRGGVGEELAVLAEDQLLRRPSSAIPWTNPPSICPMSMAEFSECPASWRMSTRSTRISPVSMSTVTPLSVPMQNQNGCAPVVRLPIRPRPSGRPR